MGDYMQQHSYQSFKQHWTTYATLLLHTPTLSTLCQQLKDTHSEVMAALLPAPDGNEAAGVVSETVDSDESMDMEFESECVSETQLYEWLLQYRRRADGGAEVDGVRDEWQRIKDGTHETIVAWMT